MLVCATGGVGWVLPLWKCGELELRSLTEFPGGCIEAQHAQGVDYVTTVPGPKASRVARIETKIPAKNLNSQNGCGDAGGKFAIERNTRAGGAGRPKPPCYLTSPSLGESPRTLGQKVPTASAVDLPWGRASRAKRAWLPFFVATFPRVLARITLRAVRRVVALVAATSGSRRVAVVHGAWWLSLAEATPELQCLAPRNCSS